MEDSRLPFYHTQLLGDSEVRIAVDYLKKGHVVAFPTETVYGLGAPIFAEASIAKIFQVKGRPSDNPLIAHISQVDQVQQIAVDIPDDFYLLAQEFFPGPLTVVLRKHQNVPLIASAGLSSIGVRMPNHPLALQLIQELGQPIVAPSANLSGKPSATTYQHVLDDFKGKIAAVLCSLPCLIGLESTVLSLIGDHPVILRPGQITLEQIKSVLKKEVSVVQGCSIGQGPILSPGMKYRHYAPKAPVKLFFLREDLDRYLTIQPMIKRLLLLNERVEISSYINIMPLTANLLYAALRTADDNAVCEVLALCDPTVQADCSLMNRLAKASQG
ncbi:MAG: L-threonylcarbamoyladenylate synthase [Chlamydiae bacterium]|nr:L-threonylcarbamoyladenylate synthase [Chlamydiota bacterium]